MLSGLKFIPRDQLDKEKDETLNDSRGERRKSGRKKEKGRRKSKRSRDSSSEDEGLEKLKSGSRRKKKWYNSEEDLPSSAEESGSDSETDVEQKKHRSRTKEKNSKKKAKSRRKEYSSEDESVDASESEKSSEDERHHKRRNSRRKEDEKRGGHDVIGDNDVIDNNKGSQGSQSQNYNNNVRKEMGLDWMLRPKDNTEKISIEVSEIQPEEVTAEKTNPRELNPYLKDSGSGYPEESDGKNAGGKQLLSSAVVGDGGASWRLKALKRAQEQATREGRKVKEVVEERWSSIGHLAASVSSRNVASTHAHLQAINSRRRGLIKEESTNLDKETADTIEKDTDRTSLKDFTPRHPKMRVPKVHDSLSWGKRGNKQLSNEDAALVSAAMSDLNKFSNDGSFLDEFVRPRNDRYVDPSDFSYENSEGSTKRKSVGSAPSESKEDVRTVKPTMSANQLAAKALQLRMKGKLEEAEQLLKEAENIKAAQDTGNDSSRPRIDGTTSRFIMNDVSTRQKKKEEDGDLNLAQKIVHNHRYSVSGQADEEYDYDDGPKKKTRKKGGEDNRQSSQINYSAKRILTQQERCQFCFENPSRPKHLVVAIGNFTYLALPQRQPVVPGHCGILTLQHESSTRTVDDNVWDEIRNFKKCLIMMFAKQERDVVFLETVMGLAQQRRHCMVECIPLPPEVAKQAPVYFKKAIDEAEDEWSQHNAKKLIDTSQKGLRASIPKNFPYFHVEFGLNKGFVHVIDDEKEFKSSFGINVIRGLLQLPAEDMHRRQRHESVESQRQAVASFARDWEPFDWTKQLI